MVDCGKSVKPRFKTFSESSEAEGFALQVQQQKQELGTASFQQLSPDDRIQLTYAKERLAPFSSSIKEAVDYYIDRHLRFKNAKTVAEIADELVAKVGKKNRRARTVQSLRNKLSLIKARFGDKKLTDIAFEEIEKFVESVSSPYTQRNYRQTFGQLFRFAIRNGWANENPIERIDTPQLEEKEPEVFRVEQIECLLRHAARENSRLLLLFALQAFGGLRKTEALRIDWNAFKWDDKTIRIGPEVAKRRSRRVAQINPTLEAWIKPLAKESGKVVDYIFPDKVRRELMKNCNIAQWVRNGLRHSFGSYHYAKYGDATLTARLMGHSKGEEVFHNHYKALVSKPEAERYWSLRP